MALDYSTLSDAELEAIANEDYSKLSDATLKAIAEDGAPVAEEPGVMGKIGQTAGGVAGMAVDAATGAYNAIPYKELVIPYAGYKMLPKVAEGVKSGYGTMKNFVSGAGQALGPVNPVPPGATASPSYTVPAAQQAEQNAIQRGMQYADKVRQIAMEKVLQGAQKAAPVARAAAPAAIGLGGMLYSPGLNQGEEEELRRRRAMMPTIR